MGFHLIIVGSPYAQGKSAHLASKLVQNYEGEDPEGQVSVFDVATHDVEPCTSCDGCKGTRECVIDDDMQHLYEMLDQADDLSIVSPVFFAGPPAQLKAVYDRFQLYYWTDARKAPKRQAQLYVLGEGGDPHGFEPLVVITRSALSVAGFKLGTVHDCVGLSLEEIDA